MPVMIKQNNVEQPLAVLVVQGYVFHVNNRTITCACGYSFQKSKQKDSTSVLESKRIEMEVRHHLSKYLQGFCTLVCSLLFYSCLLSVFLCYFIL